MKMITMIALALIAAGVFAGVHNTKAPHAPLARGVREGILATRHWRLVMEEDQEGVAILRRPINDTFYKDPDKCAQDGSALEVPKRNDAEHTDWLIRCLPYHDGQDTNDSTPIGADE